MCVDIFNRYYYTSFLTTSSRVSKNRNILLDNHTIIIPEKIKKLPNIIHYLVHIKNFWIIPKVYIIAFFFS